MGPYCNFCNNRCFVYFPEGTPQEALDAYHCDIIATCPQGQAFERERTGGWCYDRIKEVISAQAAAQVNWTPDSIFTARDHHVRAKDGILHPVRLYVDGWAVGKWEGMDIWSACRVLNDLQATIPTAGDLAAQGFYAEE